MRKVLLGLILSAGMSSVAFASGDVKNEYLANAKEIIDCTINTQIITRDANGVEINNEVVITTGSGSECADAMNGTVYKLKMVRVPRVLKETADIQP